MSEPVVLSKSNLLILAFQLDGVALALRHALSCGQPPSGDTIKTLQKFKDEFVAMHTGQSLNVLPSIDEITAPCDLLIFTEILRSTMAAFLSSEELIEKQRAIGFASSR